MHEPTSITVVMKFRASQGASERWLDIWGALRDFALEVTECSTFEVSWPSLDGVEGTVVSSWPSREHFNRFARESGLLWLDRVLHVGCTCPHTILVNPQGADERELTMVGA